jgi:hypothetical protein
MHHFHRSDFPKDIEIGRCHRHIAAAGVGALAARHLKGMDIGLVLRSCIAASGSGRWPSFLWRYGCVRSAENVSRHCRCVLQRWSESHVMGTDAEHTRTHMTIAMPGSTTQSLGLLDNNKPQESLYLFQSPSMALAISLAAERNQFDSLRRRSLKMLATWRLLPR